MRRLTLRFPVHKPPSVSAVAGRLAHQKPNSILKTIKPFHLSKCFEGFHCNLRSDSNCDDYRLGLDACWIGR
jgi:hypothetical protein